MVYANNLQALPGALLQNEHCEGHESGRHLQRLSVSARWLDYKKQLPNIQTLTEMA